MPTKIVLCDPPVVNKLRYRSYLPNIGILYLSSYLKRNKKDVEVYYLESFLSLEDHVKRVKEINPDVYGISFASYLKGSAFTTLKAVKKEIKNLKIIAGGPHPTIKPEECINEGVDVCVLGEGEETFLQLINLLFEGDKYKQIHGIAYRESDNEVKFTKKRDYIVNLDDIPFPDWELSSEKKYTGEVISRGHPTWMAILSRGCPFNCNFCANPIWKYNKPWVRFRSPENIAQEISLLYKKGYREITLRCDEFNASLEWSKNVCRAIKNLNLKDMYFSTLLRATPIDEEFCKLLKEMNCWSVNLGIESANERVLKGIHKEISIAEVIKCCEFLRKYKIRIFGFFLMYNVWEENGQPQFETSEEVMNTLTFAKSLLKRGLLNNMSWGFVSPIPGSDLYNMCERHNLISGDAYLVSKYKTTTIKNPNLDTEMIKKLKREGEILRIINSLKNDVFNLNLKNYRYLLGRLFQGLTN